MAIVLPFPRARDRGFVSRQAHRMASGTPQAAENWLTHVLSTQQAAMRRRGVDEAVVGEQIKSIEMAIRCELNRLVVSTGGAA